MKSRLFSFCLLLLIAAPLPAFSWYDFGHMEVACVAYKRLTPQTRARADSLLQLNPYYSKWAAAIPTSIPPEDKNLMIFMQAATWPDLIKGDKTYTSDGSNNGHKADDPAAGQNTGYSDHLLHKYWHFTDSPFSIDGTPLPPLEKYNAQTQIASFRKVLASNSGDDIKSYDLTWLIHLVGDVHQPLHCAMRISKIDTEGDAGGNKVRLHNERGGPNNLHSFWDGLPGDERTPLHVQKATRKLRKADPQEAAISDERVWVAKSFDLAKKKVYTGPIKDADGPYRTTSGYKNRAYVLSKRQVELAGERLANLLNNELK